MVIDCRYMVVNYTHVDSLFMECIALWGNKVYEGKYFNINKMQSVINGKEIQRVQNLKSAIEDLLSKEGRKVFCSDF